MISGGLRPDVQCTKKTARIEHSALLHLNYTCANASHHPAPKPCLKQPLEPVDRHADFARQTAHVRSRNGRPPSRAWLVSSCARARVAGNQSLCTRISLRNVSRSPTRLLDGHPNALFPKRYYPKTPFYPGLLVSFLISPVRMQAIAGASAED